MTISREEMEHALWGEGQITPRQLEAARQTVRWCSGLSRCEVARTICEHWGWVTASGSYKVTACLKVLEAWEARGLLQLPGKRPMTRWKARRLAERRQPREPTRERPWLGSCRR